METNCAKCGRTIQRRPVDLQRSKTGNLYCSKSCSNSSNNSLFRQHENNPNYTHGRSSYRNRRLKESEMKCERCGFDDPRALQVHHKDKNRKNNRLENLELLCANCHLIEHSNSE